MNLDYRKLSKEEQESLKELLTDSTAMIRLVRKFDMPRMNIVAKLEGVTGVTDSQLNILKSELIELRRRKENVKRYS